MSKNRKSDLNKKLEKTSQENMYWEENRLKTFSNWPFGDDCKCNPAKMAEAGFYACGSKHENDLAKCFCCSKELDGWEADDDPWKEHKMHSKKCMFLKYGKPEAELTAAEHIDLLRYFYTYLCEKKAEQSLKHLEDKVNKALEPLL